MPCSVLTGYAWYGARSGKRRPGGKSGKPPVELGKRKNEGRREGREEIERDGIMKINLILGTKKNSIISED